MTVPTDHDPNIRFGYLSSKIAANILKYRHLRKRMDKFGGGENGF